VTQGTTPNRVKASVSVRTVNRGSKVRVDVRPNTVGPRKTVVKRQDRRQWRTVKMFRVAGKGPGRVIDLRPDRYKVTVSLPTPSGSGSKAVTKRVTVRR
jgi:hypothetical protein